MKPINQFKTTATVRRLNRQSQLPPAARRVAVTFSPPLNWTIEVGTAGPARVQRRNPPPARPGDRPACGFAPIELVIAAENKKRAHWQVRCRAPLWDYQFK